MSNNQTEQLKAQAIHLRNMKSNLENQITHIQIISNGIDCVKRLLEITTIPDELEQLTLIKKFIIVALSNSFVPPTSPKPMENPPVITKEMTEAAQKQMPIEGAKV